MSQEIQPKLQFVIVSEFHDFEEEHQYWNNESGWGTRHEATVFDDVRVRDPIGATGREFCGVLYPVPA